MKNEIKTGTEVVSDGLRGVVTVVSEGDAWITWETGEFYTCAVSSIRKGGPAVVNGIATVRLARGENRLQHLI
jgi:hypothetical protein